MTLSSCNGTVLAQDIGSTFVDGYGPISEAVCLEIGLGGLVVEVDGGFFSNEVSWSITLPSSVVEEGGAGISQSGLCVSPYPTPQPSVTSMPTAPCEQYRVEIYAEYGDG